MELQVHSDQEKTYLIIINNGPNGDERAYNGFRLAMNLQKHQHGTPDVFLMGDGVQCAVGGQNTPSGYYNIERMIKYILSNGSVYT